MSSGVEKAWSELEVLRPEEIYSRTGVTYDRQAARYTVGSFGQDISVFPADRIISSCTPLGGYIAEELRSYSHLAILEYLIHAKNVLPTDHLIKPDSLSGGQIYSKGTHALPLDQLAKTYGDDRNAFVARGRSLGGTELQFGDASARLHPLPRLPVAVILWERDEEFPPRTDFLFYDNCKEQLPPDILWATAMMTIRLMLKD